MYLAEKYAKDDKRYYPTDIGERTKVNRLLFFQLGTLHRTLSTYYYPIIAGLHEGKPEDFRKIEDAVCVLNKFLDGNKWLAGEHLTIADFSVVISVAALEGVIKFDLTGYEHVHRWYQQCKKEFKRFEELTQNASEKSKQLMEALRQYKLGEINGTNGACCSGETTKPPSPKPPCPDSS